MTDLSPPEHETSAAVDEAARWLAETPDDQKPHPVLPAVRQRWGLSTVEAIAAIRESHLIRARAA